MQKKQSRPKRLKNKREYSVSQITFELRNKNTPSYGKYNVVFSDYFKA